jgi:vanillate/4-hydroxybenzoate decarboxylase subunit D
VSNFSFARPTELAPRQARETVAGSCPDCQATELMRYPVLSEGGWFMVVKCQACLHSVSREPWALLGPVRLLTDDLA